MNKHKRQKQVVSDRVTNQIKRYGILFIVMGVLIILTSLPTAWLITLMNCFSLWGNACSYNDNLIMFVSFLFLIIASVLVIKIGIKTKQLRIMPKKLTLFSFILVIVLTILLVVNLFFFSIGFNLTLVNIALDAFFIIISFFYLLRWRDGYGMWYKSHSKRLRKKQK